MKHAIDEHGKHIKDERKKGAWMYMSLASSHKKKAKGFLFTSSSNKALMLVPCNDVHTYCMKGLLDIAFINEEGRVLKAYKKVAPQRRLKQKGACATIERFSSDEPWFQENEQVCIGSSVKGKTHENMSCM